MSTFPFLPICCILWVQRSDGWKAESNSWSFHLAKMKRQLQGKSKENIFQLFSLPFLSPFWAWLSLYLMKRSLVSLFFPSPNINLFTPRLAYQSPILPVHGTCSSLVLEAVLPHHPSWGTQKKTTLSCWAPVKSQPCSFPFAGAGARQGGMGWLLALVWKEWSAAVNVWLSYPVNSSYRRGYKFTEFKQSCQVICSLLLCYFFFLSSLLFIYS